MSHTKYEAASNLARKLLDAEVAIDRAFELAADLASYMPIARQNANASIAVGHDALVSLTAVLGKLGDARGDMMNAHDALAKAQRRIGVEEVNYGSFVDKPHRRWRASKLRVVDQSEAA